MYFPYIRGKQFDLQAIRELNYQYYTDNKIMPIIEPVNLSRNSLSNYRLLVQTNVPFILILNPKVGRLQNDYPSIRTNIINNILGQYNNFTVGFIIDENESITSIRNFINANQGRNKAFIHYQNFGNVNSLDNLISNANGNNFNIFIERRVSDNYPSLFGNHTRKVLISDGFIRRIKNAAYPDNDFFSGLYQTYSNNYFGFGDYSIIGSDYIDGGWAAFAIVLHISYANPLNNNDLFVRHFVSDDNATQVNPGNKFAEALLKFIRYRNANRNLIQNTSGVRDLISYHRSGEYHGLGDIKRICILHHIELICSLI
jgi:hypothetical protein